jgi:hypothetical protein
VTYAGGEKDGGGKVSALGRVTLPDGREAMCLLTSDEVGLRSGNLLVARWDRSISRVFIDGITSWSSRGGPDDCTLETKEIGGRTVLVEHHDDDGTCDNASSELIVYSLTDPELTKLADLEVAGRVVPCGSGDIWVGDHSTVVEFGPELRLTTKITWSQLPDDMHPDARPPPPPVTRVFHRSLRFVGDRLVDPMRPDASDTPGVEVGNHP